MTMEITSYGDGGWKVTLVAAILMFMQILAVTGRIISRSMKKARLAVDDYILMFGTVLTFALCALAMTYPRIANVRSRNDQGSLDSSFAKQAFLAWTILYGLSIAAAKWAILLLYLRVFTMRSRPFSITVYIMGFIITATAVINTFAAIFQCSPIHAAWQGAGSHDAKQAKCLNMAAFDEYMAIPNVITGAVMILMPLPPVLRLNVATLQKIALSATFLHGAIGLFASSARLYILSHPSSLSSSTSPITTTIYTINEPANYIIAACLPTLRPIFVAILPERFFILSRQRASANSGSPYYTTALKITWPRGRLVPKVAIERGGNSWWGQMESPLAGQSGSGGRSRSRPTLTKGMWRSRQGSWGRDVERALGGVEGKVEERREKRLESATTAAGNSVDEGRKNEVRVEEEKIEVIEKR